MVSDCDAVRDIFTGHHFRPTQAQSSAISLVADICSLFGAHGPKLSQVIPRTTVSIAAKYPVPRVRQFTSLGAVLRDDYFCFNGIDS